MADEWEVVSETPEDQFQPTGRAGPMAAAPEPQAEGDDPWAVVSEAPVQVHAVQQAAAAKPKDPRKKSELLGVAKGSTGAIDKFWNRVDQIPLVGDYLNDPGEAMRGNPLALARQAERGLIHNKALPAVAEAEKTHRAGGIGTFIGDQLPYLASGGPILSGAVQGFTESDAAPGDWLGVAKDTAMGAGLGKLGDFATRPVTEFVGKQVVKNLAKFKPDVEIPKLHAVKEAAYQRLKDLGVSYTPQAGRKLVTDLEKTLTDFRAHRGSHGPAFDVLETIKADMRSPTMRNPNNVDELRKIIFRDVAGSSHPPTAELGAKMAKALDSWIDNTDARSIKLPGLPPKAMNTPAALTARAAQAKEAQEAIDAARQAHKQYRNVELIDRKHRAAESRTKRIYAGGNIDNKIRQTLGPLMDPDSRRNISRFLHPEQMAQLVKTVEGTGGQNALRAVGRLSPFGGGLKFLASLGAASATGGASGVLSAAGLVSKHLADKATRKNVSTLMEMIASGGGKEAMLAERQLRALAKRNEGVGKIISAVEDQAARLAGRGLVTAQIEHERSQGRELEDAKARAQR